MAQRMLSDVELDMNSYVPSQMPPRFVAPRERALWVAVLDDALRCAAGRMNGGGNESDQRSVSRRATEAQAWIDDASEGTGSFLWICAVLELDGFAVRDELRRVSWRERQRRLDLRLPSSEAVARWRAGVGRKARDFTGAGRHCVEPRRQRVAIG